MGKNLRGAVVVAALIGGGIALVGPTMRAEGQSQEQGRQTGQGKQPLTDDQFELAAPRGFGDRNNSWAQAMVWWHDHLYVGTARQSLCTSLFSLWSYFGAIFGREFVDTYLPYPPHDPDLSCAPDGADLSLQAEIWRWTPQGEVWDRVFQSPLDLDNPGIGGGAPPRIGKKLPYEIAFRGLTGFTEPDGTEALYAFGINSTVMWDRTKLPPPRILRSTDGVNFTPVPQTPGTFLGDLPFNDDHSSFRSPQSYQGKLFVLSGPIFGQGSLIGSADPAKGDNAWFVASPSGLLFYELQVFNGWFYLGAFDPAGGYAVVKTRAEGPPPYQFETVIPSGAFLTDRPSKSVVSMHVFEGRLYVGTATYTEIVRINPDDTWDLVIGQPRSVPGTGPNAGWKYPLSGLDAGFGHSLNDHAWQMDDPYGYFYVGTYNASIGSKNDPVAGPLLAHNMGAHLYRSPDGGWYDSAVTTDGFANQSDPFGGRFDYGIRTMTQTPYGEFLGTVNDFYGLAIFRGRPGKGFPGIAPPQRVEIDSTTTGGALLSWEKSFDMHVPGDWCGDDPDAHNQPRLYQVWRAEIKPILVRDDINIEAWNGVTGNKIPDTYVGPYEQIATTTATSYTDLTVQPGSRYMYYVLVQPAHGKVSEQSNLVRFPLLTPAVTFDQLLDEVQRWDLRGRLSNPAMRLAGVRELVVAAQRRAASCAIGSSISLLNSPQLRNGVVEPEETDFEILIAKLVRRMELFVQMPEQVQTDEFCTYQ